MQPGIFYGMSFEDYLKIPAVNKSSLEHFDRSPAHFYAEVLDPDREIKPPTKAMKLGTEIHTSILEPERFALDYVIEPENAPKRPTKTQLEAKKPSEESIKQIEYWKAFDEANAGKHVITAANYKTCVKIREAVRNHAAAQAIFEEGAAEVVIVWEDLTFGVLCKARFDWLSLTSGVAMDLKSTDDARHDEFAKKVANYNWHVQAAFYLDGINTLKMTDTFTFIFGAIEKSAPYQASFYYPTKSVLEAGRLTYKRYLAEYRHCQSVGQWPGYREELTPLELPAWALKDVSKSAQGYETEAPEALNY